MAVRTSDELLLRLRSLDHSVFNLRTLRHRHFDAVLVSMRQSGTHWVWYMLSLTLAKLYDLPPPTYIGDKSIVGSPKIPPLYTQIPQIYHTHRIPHYSLRSRVIFRLLGFPRHLILVRDLRDSLVSHYEKHKGSYQVSFSTFLRGDIRRNAYRYDIWTRIQYLNGWGAVAERHPEDVAVLKYEDLVADTPGQLGRRPHRDRTTVRRPSPRHPSRFRWSPPLRCSRSSATKGTATAATSGSERS